MDLEITVHYLNQMPSHIPCLGAETLPTEISLRNAIMPFFSCSRLIALFTATAG